MYGLLFWVYIWLTMALWRVEPGAWMFLVIVTMFYLIIDLISNDWRIHLAGCLLFYPLQWHHPAVLHASWREESFWHAVIHMRRGGVIACLGAYPRVRPKHQSK